MQPSHPTPQQTLSSDERGRYARQLILPEVGLAGHERLKAAAVLCVGAGGLGSPLLLYLAAAGIGRIGIVDGDAVELSNLQRQVIHRSDAVGRSKARSAAKSMWAPPVDTTIAGAFCPAPMPAANNSLVGGLQGLEAADCEQPRVDRDKGPDVQPGHRDLHSFILSDVHHSQGRLDDPRAGQG